jgi:hypothetical protein
MANGLGSLSNGLFPKTKGLFLKTKGLFSKTKSRSLESNALRLGSKSLFVEPERLLWERAALSWRTTERREGGEGLSTHGVCPHPQSCVARDSYAISDGLGTGVAALTTHMQHTVIGPVGEAAPFGIGWLDTEQLPAVTAYCARTLPGTGLSPIYA